jgi:hypothetical protein
VRIERVKELIAAGRIDESLHLLDPVAQADRRSHAG